ncbi:MAG: DUF4147 domain-containing protein, partial [Deltaproteobacteria bacterium]|nr:DUF4147 domain-containing protein [Deltaproteobacteria bacterium]
MKTDLKKINTRRVHALDIFKAGLESVAPGSAIARHCRRRGKAGAAMAAEMEAILGDWISGGVISVKYGHLAELNRIQIVEAGHPVPDQNGENGALAISAMAESAESDDLIICLISGGG